eukprot:2468746-Pyramimonas_sp.AAC.1
MPIVEPQRLPGKKTVPLPSDVATSNNRPSPPAVPPPLPFFVRKPQKQLLGLSEALQAVKGNATAKFDETVEIAIQLGVDPK